MNIVINIIIFVCCMTIGNILNYFGNKLSSIKGYKYSDCDYCHKNNIIFFPLTRFILNKGRCNHCNNKYKLLPIFTELVVPFLFYIAFNNVKNDPIYIYLLFSLCFISSLVIVFVSDIKNMIIPDEVLLLFGFVLVCIKLYMLYYNETINTLLDLGYEIIFMLYEGLFMFLIMYVIKKTGDFLFKKDSMGGGDVKLMFFISMFMGWKISLCILFFSAFLALPESAINMYRNKNNMLAFGPYIVIATLIIYLANIDINMILGYLI